MSQELSTNYVAYTLVNADKLGYHIDCNVTLIGKLEEQDSVLIACTGEDSETRINLKNLSDIGAFPNNSKVAEIKGKVLDDKSIQFH